MEGGSYNSIYKNHGTPMSASTPTYQANVYRTKTRKWVEAKAQNYDGDEWGADEFDENEEDYVEGPSNTIFKDPVGPTDAEAKDGGGGVSSISVPSQTSVQTGGSMVSQTSPVAGRNLGGTSRQTGPSGPPAPLAETQPQPQCAPLSTSCCASTELRPAARISDPPLAAHDSGAAGGGAPLCSPTAFHPGQPEYGEHTSNPAPVGTNTLPQRTSSMSSKKKLQYRPVDGEGSALGLGARSSASPENQGSEASAGVQSLPFPRPADVYRRLEEDRQRESDRVGVEEMRSDKEGLDGRRDETAGTQHGSEFMPYLPKAGGRSEHGPGRAVRPGQVEPSAAGVALPQEPSLSPAPPATLRPEPTYDSNKRLSVSPKLPDLGRMSVFGDDIFSSPGSVSASSPEPPMPTMPGVAQTATRSQSPNDGESRNVSRQLFSADMGGSKDGQSFGLAHEPASHEASSATEGPVPASTTAAVATTTKSTKSNSSVLPRTETKRPEHTTASAEQSPSRPGSIQIVNSPSLTGSWVTETLNQGTESETQTTKRPSLPGAWVTETNIGAESGTTPPMARSEDGRSKLDNVTEAPVSDVHRDSIDRRSGIHKGSPSGDGGVDFTTPPPRSPRNLPPLRTQSPLIPSQTGPPPLVDPTEANDSGEMAGERTGTAGTYDSSVYSGSVNARNGTNFALDYMPTAPLNPRSKDGPDGYATLPPATASSSRDATSSNDNEELRDEIMKSLAPMQGRGRVTPGLSSTDDQLVLGEMSRESRYLSGVYDEYLDGKYPQEPRQENNRAPSTDKSLAEQHSEQLARFNSMPEVAPLSPRKSPESEAVADSSRFSWDGPEPTALASSEDSTFQHSGGAKIDPPAVSESQTGRPAVQVEREASVHSRQVSSVSSRFPEGLGEAGLDPSSPVSIRSAEKKPAGYDHSHTVSRPVSPADKEALVQPLSLPVSPDLREQETHQSAMTQATPGTSPTREKVVRPGATTQEIKMMTWTEILGLPTPAERIQKFEDMRAQYAAMNTGLGDWLSSLSEGVSAQSPVPDVPQSATSGSTQGQSSGTGEQAYYQQYMEASSTDVAAAPTRPPTRLTRANTISQRHGSEAGASGFGQSGTQVGVKSKELLHAAGALGNKATKSGLKLFSKGKNKLKEKTGDKAFF